METNVNYTIVGAFVIFLLAATILGIIWLSSGFSFEQYTTYLVYEQESVSGLSIDSPVEYNGVNVGAVKSVELNHKNPHLVELLLNIKSTTPITQGTVATLNTRGVTGITFIALKDDSTNLTPLTIEKGQSYPIIKTAPSLFTRLDTALTKLTDNIGKVSESIQSVLNKENQEAIKETLANFAKITSNISANSDRINRILENTANLSKQLSPLMQSSQSTIRMLETQTLPSAVRLMNNMDEVSRSLLTVTNEIKSNPSILIRGKEHPPLGPGETK